MFFYAAKIGWFVLQPLAAILLVAILGLLAGWLGRPRIAAGLFLLDPVSTFSVQNRVRPGRELRRIRHRQPAPAYARPGLLYGFPRLFRIAQQAPCRSKQSWLPARRQPVSRPHVAATHQRQK